MNTELQILEARLEGAFQRGNETAGSALRRLAEQGKMMNDHLVPIRSMDYVHDSSEGTEPAPITMLFRSKDEVHQRTMHEMAVRQLSDRLELPGTFMRDLSIGTTWMRQLAVRTLSDFTQHTNQRNVLMRAVGGEARAVLSDKYRRMNNLPIFTQFIHSALDRGARLYDGCLTDKRMFAEVLHPHMVQVDTPKNGRVYAVLGAQIGSSDFGHGSLEVRSYWLQVRCLNGMVGQTHVREVHLGKRLDEASFAFSEDTYNLDTKTMASAVQDIGRGLFTDEHREQLVAGINKASEHEMSGDSVSKSLPKMGVHKEELSLVEELLMRSNPEQGVQGDLTKWKVAQALTAVANNEGVTGGRKRELQSIAGELIGMN